MSTAYPELFAALAAPFKPEEVKSRQQAGRTFQYITARTCMNRLDEVLGPENWVDEFVPIDGNSMLCRLTITLPDGRPITKCDAGGSAGMSDAGDDDKSMISDAFKRACVKFGLARYLYRDGVPDFAREVRRSVGGPAAEIVYPRNGTSHGRGQYPAPQVTAAYVEWVKDIVGRVNAEWIDAHMKPGGEIPDGVGDLLTTYQLNNHLLKWGIKTSRLADVGLSADPQTGQPVPKASTEQAKKYVSIIFDRDRKALEIESSAYVEKLKWEKFVAARESGEDG